MSGAGGAGPDRLLVVHYHLQPGGVTTVIRDGLSALLASGNVDWLRELVVVAAGGGRRHADRDDHDALLRALQAAQGRNPQSTTTVRVEVDPALAYRSRSTAADQSHLSVALGDRYGDALWWVHNYHLGKNTALTGAVLRAADRGQPMLLQIHDFPECGRRDNLRRVTRDCGTRRYPRAPHVHYLTINRRDADILRGAGLGTDAVSLLPNPVSPPPSAAVAPGSDEAQSARRRLLEAQRQGPWWAGRVAPDHPLWLYPVRARRRKNVFEAAVLATLADANLLVTLPALSSAERRYGRAVRREYASGCVAGAYGIGDMPPHADLSFGDLVAAADAVVSTSIEEGFGYAYVSALQWRRPLVARQLHVAADLDQILAASESLLYDRLATPVTASECRQARDAHRLLGAVPPADAPTLDFAQLPLRVQQAVLRRLAEPGYRRELQGANATLLADLRRLAPPAGAEALARIDAALGPGPFAQRAARLLSALRTTAGGGAGGGAATDDDTGKPRGEPSVEAAVAAQFDTPETARMLVAG